jgi:asparagine synthase (glutamine-hydrolysing)
MLGRGDVTAVAAMLEAQKHRGPDGRNVRALAVGGAGGLGGGESGAYGAVLGHDRLAIVDLAGGAQPIANEDGTLWTTVNGEIYNHAALRQTLAERHSFRTGSDSEVVLHLFEEHGPEFVRRLDGMFAVVLWSEATGLYLARDPLGIKPLYYGYDDDGCLRWASEIKGLLAGGVTAVRALPPGSWWMPGRSAEPVRYYLVPSPAEAVPGQAGSMWSDPAEAVDAVEHTLLEAVRKRLMADVPVGVFLSGGLDSSLIAAMARRLTEGDLHSFAVGLEGSADLGHARRVAGCLGTVHHEWALTPEMVAAALPAVIDALESCDPALVRSAIPTYYVAGMASSFVKVVLSGEGADELFAGYQYLDGYEEGALSAELHAITCGLHNSNLQRVDRMTMAHGLEARVPFLDVALVDLAFRMDPKLLRREGEAKWVLRKAAERWLPPEIVWRKKEKFAVGTGIGSLLERCAAETADPAPGFAPEEWLYWTHFRDRYGRKDIVASMGRSRSLNPGQVWVSALGR